MEILKKERIEYFDYCKGLLIILVVLGHVMPEDAIVHIWLYSWHMPAFFIINGMLLSYTNFSVRTLVGKRGIIRNGVIRLLIPYYVYGIFLLIARWVNSGLELSNLRWQLMDLGLFCGIGATWFLPCLFIAQILYYGVAKSVYILRKYSKCNGTMVKIILAFVIGCIPFIAPNINFVSLVLYRSFLAILFLIIGDLLLGTVLKFRRIENVETVILMLVSALVSIAFFVLTDMNSASFNILKFGNPILYILNAFLGSAFMFFTVKVIEQTKNRIILEILEFYGRFSLTIMGTHQIVILLLQIPVNENYIFNLVFCAIVLLVEIPMVFLIMRWKSVIKLKG